MPTDIQFRHRGPRRNGMAAFLLALVLTWPAITGTAHAQDIVTACVVCTQPATTYRCEVIPPESGQMARSPQLFCASEVAQAGRHKSCTVVRSAGAACDGRAVTLAYTGPVNDDPAPLDAAATPPVEAPASESDSEPPKTLVEATDRAVKSTGTQIKKAGNAVSSAGKAVGDVTKKTGETLKETGESVGSAVTDAATSTWRCLASLFQSC